MDLADPSTWPRFALCGTNLDRLPARAGGLIWQQKLDGVRVYTGGGRVKLRGGEAYDAPLLRLRSGAPVPPGILLDGELLHVDGHATSVMPDLGRLHQGDQRAAERIFLMPFDVLCDRGEDMRDEPYRHRYEYLRELRDDALAVHAEDDAALTLDLALGWEGLICRDPRAAHKEGRQAGLGRWKASWVLEARIMGFEDGKGARKGLPGAVIFGLPLAERMVRVGTAGGLTAADIHAFHHRPTEFIGRRCRIRHRGLNHKALRNPTYEGLIDDGA